MTEMVESGAVETELEQDQPQISDEQLVEQNSPDLWQEFGERISVEIDKRFQSAKDKRWAELERKYGDLAGMKERADGSAANPAQDLSRLYLGLNSFLAATGLINNEAILSQVNDLSGEDPMNELTGLFLNLGNIISAERSGLKASRANQVLEGGKAGGEPDLAAQYRQRKSQLRPGDLNTLMELKREFRQKGLDIF